MEPPTFIRAECLRHEAVKHKPPSGSIITLVAIGGEQANLLGQLLSDLDSLLDAYKDEGIQLLGPGVTS